MRNLVLAIFAAALIGIAAATMFPGAGLVYVPSANGSYPIVNLYPGQILTGQWVLFRGDDGRSYEAFVRCARTLKMGEGVVIHSKYGRGRRTPDAYLARCTNDFLPWPQ